MAVFEVGDNRVSRKKGMSRGQGSFRSPHQPRYSADPGIINPICLAVFRLMINSSFFGCSIGNSARSGRL